MGKIIKPNGFTLIELVIVAALMAILSVGVVSLFILTIRGGLQAKLQANLKAQGDRVMTTMERNLRNSRTMYNCLPANPGNSVEFSVLDGSLTMIQNYTIDGTTVVFNDGSMSTNLLVDPNITNLSGQFTCVEGNAFTPGSVIINLTLEMTSSGVTVSQQFQTSVAMRNL